MERSEEEYVRTTRPIIPPYSEHPTITTRYPNIVLRPFKVNDLDALHELRTQIDVMKWTSTAKVDADIGQTKTWLRRFMDIEEELHQSNDEEVSTKVDCASNSSTKFNFAIVQLYPQDMTGSEEFMERVIGAGGCHVIDPQPEVGYMIRKEYWGQGIVTAVLEAFLGAYWHLERRSITVPTSSLQGVAPRVVTDEDCDTGDGGQVPKLPETLAACIVATNTGSRRVLEKCGFNYRRSELVEEHGVSILLEHWTSNKP